MGCFLDCFGGDKRRKQRLNHRRRNRIENFQPENVVIAEPSVKETAPVDLVSEVSEFRNRHEVVEHLSPSSRKRVTFDSNVTTYEHVPLHESIESLRDSAANEEKNHEDLKCSRSQSISRVGSYPPNHRYHNARESDDEAEEYGDSDLDDEDDYMDDDINARLLRHEVWSESVSTASMESRAGSCSPPASSQEVESLNLKTQLTDEEVKELGSNTNGRDRSDYINSVLNPVENVAQWKVVKSKGTTPLLKPPRKENLPNFEAPHASFSSEQAPSSFKAKSHQLRNAKQAVVVDASLSNWLASPEVVAPSKKTTFSGSEMTTTSEGCASARRFEDRPILGALTVEELRQISASPSRRKSPSRSPDERPIIGTVGTYWNNSSVEKHSGSVTSFVDAHC